MLSDDNHQAVLYQAIKEGNYTFIKDNIDSYDINQDILQYVFKSKDIKTFNLVAPYINPILDKTDIFFLAGNIYLPMALEIFKLYQEEFKNNTDILEYDNCQLINNSFFTEASLLPRFYQSLTCNNNQETFALLLLNAALNLEDLSENDTMLNILSYLVEHKTELNLRDDIIVQFLIEKQYDLDQVSYSTNQDFINLIYQLIYDGVSFKSDTQGYLLQIVCFNEMDNNKNLLIDISNQGSSAQGLIDRFEDTHNHLTEDEYDNMEALDYNNDKTYDIYKKFDENNTISTETLALLKKIQFHQKLNDSLPHQSTFTAKNKI